MRLTEEQRTKVLIWVARGLRSDEINDLAKAEQPPFSLSGRQATYYRKSRGIDFKTALAERSNSATQEARETLVVVEVKREQIKKLKEAGLLRVTPRVQTRAAKYVYLIREEHGCVKIGVSNDYERRLEEIDRSIPYSVELVALIHNEDARLIERNLHNRYDHLRRKGEWFRLSREDIAQICEEWEGIVL